MCLLHFPLPTVMMWGFTCSLPYVTLKVHYFGFIMLQELYNELQSVFGDVKSPGVSAAFRPSPKSGGTTTVFVAREDGQAWYTLDDNGNKNYIPIDMCLYGAVTNIDEAMSNPSNSKYKPSRKLKVYVTAADGQSYMLYCGFDTAFGKSLVKGLNAFSRSQLQSVAIGLTLSDQDEKVVFANVLTQEGSWEKSDNTTDIDTQYSSLRSKLGVPSKDSKPQTKAAPKKVGVKPVVDSPNLEDIPF